MTKLDEGMEQTCRVLTLAGRHKTETASRHPKDVGVRVLTQQAITAINRAMDSIADVERLLAEVDKLSNGQTNEGRMTICYQVRHDLEQIDYELTESVLRR